MVGCWGGSLHPRFFLVPGPKAVPGAQEGPNERSLVRGRELPAASLQTALLRGRNLSCSDGLGSNPVLRPPGLCDLG